MAVNKSSIKDYDMLTNIKDAGIGPELQKPFMESVQAGEWERSKIILTSHRSKLLTEIHSGQDKLYCTDILLRKLKLK